ncbi:MAG: prolyl oligopeptidase family serine peptidase [Thiotrichaceae bacterium]
MIKKIPHLENIGILLIATFSIFLISCGGDGGSGQVQNSLSPPVNSNQGGFQSISGKVVNPITSIQVAIDAAGGKNITAQYAVHTYKLEYMTRDSANALVKVSALIAVPEKTTPSPVISYQHATTFKKSEAPSLNLTVDDKSVEIAFASLGYVVFSADYVGFGSSFGNKHPYLQKTPSADAVNDMLKAGKVWLDLNAIKMNDQLFMTGYSQGGYVTMAAMQDLQNNPHSGFQITSAVLGAGPYDLNAALDKKLFGINLPGDLADLAISFLEGLIPADAEVEFETTFLRRYFDDDKQDDVHQWRPDFPIKLFHGEDDNTVPIESAESTFDTMKNLGANIELIKCTENPSGHKDCVLPYINLVVEYFEQLRHD